MELRESPYACATVCWHQRSWFRFSRLRRSPTRTRRRAKQVEFGINVAQRGLWREAIYRWEKAVELDPDLRGGVQRPRHRLRARGQLDKARKAYEKGARARAEQHARSGRTTSCSRKSMTGPTPPKKQVASRSQRSPLRAVVALACGPTTTRSRSKRRSSRSWTSRRSSACWSPASSPAAARTSTPIRKPSACCAASCAPSRRCASSTPTSCR